MASESRFPVLGLKLIYWGWLGHFASLAAFLLVLLLVCALGVRYGLLFLLPFAIYLIGNGLGIFGRIFCLSIPRDRMTSNAGLITSLGLELLGQSLNLIDILELTNLVSMPASLIGAGYILRAILWYVSLLAMLYFLRSLAVRLPDPYPGELATKSITYWRYTVATAGLAVMYFPICLGFPEPIQMVLFAACGILLICFGWLPVVVIMVYAINCLKLLAEAHSAIPYAEECDP